MTHRPSSAVVAAREAALGSVQAEVLAEQAASLAAAARRLEAALAALAAPDQAAPRGGLVEEARQALWQLVVQREACGFRNSDELVALYRVPKEFAAAVVPPRLQPRRRS